MRTNCTPLDLATIGQLSFEALDDERFPAPALCRAAIAEGGAKPAILNAANEIAVAAFLARNVRFLDITAIVSMVLDGYSPAAPASIDDVLAIDAEARAKAHAIVERMG